MLWDLVSSEWKKAKGMEKEIAQDDIPDFKNEEGPNKEDEPVVEKGEEDPPPFEPDNEEEDQSNEELLKELDNL